MTTALVPNIEVRIISKQGELVPIHELPVLSAEDAAFRLPQVVRIIKEARRLEGWLQTVISEEIAAVAGRTELLIDGTAYELKPDYEWVINDPKGLYDYLAAARERGEVTQQEMDEAVRLETTARANNSRLNALTKRLPEIDRYRQRTETPPKLRTRSQK